MEGGLGEVEEGEVKEEGVMEPSHLWCLQAFLHQLVSGAAAERS